MSVFCLVYECFSLSIIVVSNKGSDSFVCSFSIGPFLLQQHRRHHHYHSNNLLNCAALPLFYKVGGGIVITQTIFTFLYRHNFTEVLNPEQY